MYPKFLNHGNFPNLKKKCIYIQYHNTTKASAQSTRYIQANKTTKRNRENREEMVKRHGNENMEHDSWKSDTQRTKVVGRGDVSQETDRMLHENCGIP